MQKLSKIPNNKNAQNTIQNRKPCLIISTQKTIQKLQKTPIIQT